MPEIEVEIGGRTFEVSCQDGEEHYLKFAAKMLDEEASVPQQDRSRELRTYGAGAQILCDLGVRRMRVLSAPWSIHALSGFDLEVVEYVDCKLY